MRPPPRDLKTGSTARQHRKTPRVLTSITRRHAAGSISSNGWRLSVEKMAALLTRMSAPPSSAVAAFAMAAVSASLATSTLTAVAR